MAPRVHVVQPVQHERKAGKEGVVKLAVLHVVVVRHDARVGAETQHGLASSLRRAAQSGDALSARRPGPPSHAPHAPAPWTCRRGAGGRGTGGLGCSSRSCPCRSAPTPRSASARRDRQDLKAQALPARAICMSSKPLSTSVFSSSQPMPPAPTMRTAQRKRTPGERPLRGLHKKAAKTQRRAPRAGRTFFGLEQLVIRAHGCKASGGRAFQRRAGRQAREGPLARGVKSKPRSRLRASCAF